MIQELIKQVKDTEAQGEQAITEAQDEKNRLLKQAEAKAKELRRQKIEQVQANVRAMLTKAQDEAKQEIQSLKQQATEKAQQIRTRAEKNSGRAISLVIKRLTDGHS